MEEEREYKNTKPSDVFSESKDVRPGLTTTKKEKDLAEREVLTVWYAKKW